MTEALDPVLTHLRALVGMPTMNPPRAIDADGPLVSYLRGALPGFDITVTDCGGGSIIFDAKRGAPSVVFNVHLDTVPVAEGWSRDPHDLLITEDRATGLGACDIKGAAACLLSLAATTDAPMHLVFTTDEEAGQSTCIQEYLKTPPSVDQAIVAEPTLCRAVSQHRGIFSAKMEFTGVSGHSSGGGRSAVHDAARWIVKCLDDPAAAENRFNAGRVEGGVKPNMIAASAEVVFGFRNVPGTDRRDLFDRHFANHDEGVTTTFRFNGPALPNSLDGEAAEAQRRAVAWARDHDVPLGEAVDFFTEAAFFAEAGVPALVLGPGSIEQAHTADEWVALEQLDACYALYQRIITHG